MKRILSLFLALSLLLGALVLPASAATAKQVHQYLVSIAKGGIYDEEAQWWYDAMPLDEAGTLFYGIYYLEQTGYIEASVYSDDYEVTWRISSNPSPAYNAYIAFRDEQNSTGTVAIAASYNAGEYSSFKNFSGNSEFRNAMLSALNQLLPMVVELTRAILHDGGYSLAELGLTAYRSCVYIHAFDGGQVTTEPTCGSSGEQTYTCSLCGYKQTVELAPTGDHSWDQGVVFLPAECTQDGILRYTCSVCHSTKNENIPALGHDWNEGFVLREPSCTASGIRQRSCTRCAESRTEDLPALGHEWSYAETLSPTVGEVHGTARFVCSRCEQSKEDRLCAGVIFTDMPADDYWAHTPIDWAYFNRVTAGTTSTTFSPKAQITRAEAVTFLWTLAGRPEPASTENPFADVGPDKYYYMPVLWAVERGVTAGKTETQFAPKDQCTRAEIMTFLWTFAGRPAHTLSESPFEDVTSDKYYYDPILWAFENKVTGGTSETSFSPKELCTRAQVVTFLFKAKDLVQQTPEPEPDPDPNPDPNPDPEPNPDPDPNPEPGVDPTEPVQPAEP